MKVMMLVLSMAAKGILRPAGVLGKQIAVLVEPVVLPKGQKLLFFIVTIMVTAVLALVVILTIILLDKRLHIIIMCMIG